MILQINYKQIIKNFSDEINYLIDEEGFTRKEAIKLVLITTELEQIFHKIE